MLVNSFGSRSDKKERKTWAEVRYSLQKMMLEMKNKDKGMP